MDRLRARRHPLAVVVGMLLALLALVGTVSVASAHPARQASDPVSVVMAMTDAFNSGDKATLAGLLDPNFMDVTVNPPAGAPPDLIAPLSRDAFIQAAGEVHVALSGCMLAAPDTVKCNATLSGGPIPPVPSGFTEVSTLTVANGKVTRLEETLSDQTVKELSKLLGIPPGMPTTGAADSTLPLAMLAFGLITLSAGAVTRRAYARQRSR